jgi:D-alanyl-D-alanine carboxypeptidase
MTMNRTLAALGASALLALGVAACGGGDEAGTTAGTVPAATTAPAAAPIDAATRARLTRALDTSFRAARAPGVMVSVSRGDGTPWTAVRGTADPATRAPVQDDLYTRIASVTKTFTATMVLQLVDEGKLALDDPIARWFPDLSDGDEITVRMLGNMSSGIDSYSLDPTVQKEYSADPERTFTNDELIAAGTSLPRRFPPGEGFLYSNTNFVMLGRIVEAETGKPYAEALQERVFDRLDMRQSSAPTVTAIPDPHWQGFTTQFSEDGRPVNATAWSPTFAGPAGDIVSTLADTRTWTRSVGTGSLISPEAQRERLRPNPASVGNGRAYLFGLGEEDGWLAHSGRLPGFTSQIAYDPATDTSIVVLANSDIPTDQGPPAPAIFKALAAALQP